MFGLSFLSPWFLAGLAAVAGPLLLHLFARQHAPLATLPTMRFVPRAVVEQTRRRRLQDVWLLLLRVLAVALLAVLFARPFLARPAAVAGRLLTVVAVDRSFSMAGGSREAETRRLVREALAEAPAGSPVALVTFDQEAHVVVAPTASRRDVETTFDRAAVGYGGTSYGAAFRAAVELARGRPARLVLITDGQRAGADAEAWPAIPSSLDVVVRTVPAPSENLSVDMIEAEDHGFVAVVRNHAQAERRADVRWLVDGAQVSSATVALPPATAAEVRLERRVPERAVVSVTVDDNAGYAADNRRDYVTDPPTPVPVLVVTGVDAPRDDSFYVQAALEAVATRSTRFAVTVVGAGAPGLADRFVRARALVLAGTRGMDRRTREALSEAVRAGSGLLVVAGPDVEPGVVAELAGEGGRPLAEVTAIATGSQGLAVTEARHPVLAALGDTAGNLGQVRVDRAWGVRAWAGATTLLRLSGGTPALVEFPLGRGRVLLLTTDLGRQWNTWPLHPTFVPFVVEATTYLGRAHELPRNVVLGALDVPDATRPGVIENGAAGRVAVNVDPRESRLAVLTPEELIGRIERVSDPSTSDHTARDIEQGQALWHQAAWALLAVLALEALIAARPRRVSVGAETALADGAGERGAAR